MNFSYLKWIIIIGGSMRKILAFTIILILLNCTSAYVEKLVTSEGAVLELDGAVFKIPENSVRESTLVRIDKKKPAGKYMNKVIK